MHDEHRVRRGAGRVLRAERPDDVFRREVTAVFLHAHTSDYLADDTKRGDVLE